MKAKKLSFQDENNLLVETTGHEEHETGMVAIKNVSVTLLRQLVRMCVWTILHAKSNADSMRAHNETTIKRTCFPLPKYF